MIKKVLIILGLLLIFYMSFDNSKKHNDEINRLKKELKEIEKDAVKYEKEIKRLSDVLSNEKKKADSLRQLKEKVKIIRYEVPVHVNNYPVSKLDSILAEYKHPN